MEPGNFGSSFTDEDRAYTGSCFSRGARRPLHRGAAPPGLPTFERRTFKDWRRIGKITFDNAVISYDDDFVIHFNHPTWRDDRNDPSTATRVDGRKVR